MLASLVLMMTAAMNVTSLPPLSPPSSSTLSQDSEVSPSQLLKVHGLFLCLESVTYYWLHILGSKLNFCLKSCYLLRRLVCRSLECVTGIQSLPNTCWISTTRWQMLTASRDFLAPTAPPSSGLSQKKVDSYSNPFVVNIVISMKAIISNMYYIQSHVMWSAMCVVSGILFSNRWRKRSNLFLHPFWPEGRGGSPGGGVPCLPFALTKGTATPSGA